MPTLELDGTLIAEKDNNNKIISHVDQLSEATSGGGITLSHSLKNSSGSEIISSSGLIESPTFVGMIASFAMSTAPTGWIVCNGAEYAIADYGDLHTAIGTTWGALTNGSGGAGSTHFRVPDLRGAFLRGTGSHGSSTMANSSVFAGPSVGSFEDDSFQGHFHTFLNYAWFSTTSNYELVGVTGQLPPANDGNAGSGVKDAKTDGTNGTPRTGDETRPFNAGINYCIKY